MIYFKFNNKFYKQKSGLPMGSPLGVVLACLFLEFLNPSFLNKDYQATVHSLDILKLYLFSYPKI